VVQKATKILRGFNPENIQNYTNPDEI
jgi:hypothetical protein